MTRIGTPLSPTATRVLLCGCGELGKEVVIELQRLGVEVIAVDRYANAPAMQVAHRSHVVNMLDGVALRAVIEAEKPHYIVPEIEAIATATLVELENEGFTVVPTARATLEGPALERVHFLRDELGLTGTHVGCDTTQCGCCVVHVDGKAVKSCTMLAVQASGKQVTTIEGLAAADGCAATPFVEQATVFLGRGFELQAEEIVEGLGLAALGRPIGGREQSRGADKHEVPP